MNMVTLLVQFLVVLGFLWRAAGKLLGFERSRASFEAMGLGRPWRWGLGTLELLGGLGMLASMAQPFLVFFVCVLLTALLIGAFAAQFLRKSTKGTAMVGLLLAGTSGRGPSPSGGPRRSLQPTLAARRSDATGSRWPRQTSVCSEMSSASCTSTPR